MFKTFSFSNRAIIYATRIVIGCTIVWWSLYYLHDNLKLYALISVIVVSDPDLDVLRDAMISRVINTVMGCLLGLLFVYIEVSVRSMMVAIGVSVVISTSFKKYPASWKLAPVTVTLVMMATISENVTWREAMGIALSRTGEILYGSLVAFLLGLFFSYIKKKKSPADNN
jgi:uncharacterized membrane protein YccC